MKYPGSFDSHVSGSHSSEARFVKVDKMSPGKITNAEGRKTERRRILKYPLGLMTFL